MRIVFLGDSLTWGGYGGDFVKVVTNLMPDHIIINAGVGGDTVINLLRRLDDVLEQTQPDTIFVMVGGNDATSYSMPRTRGYYRKAKQIEDGMVTPDEFETTYSELLERLKLNFVQPLVGLAPTEYSAELVAAKRAYNEIARRVAERMVIPILDLDAIFSPDNPIDRPPVGLHFIQEIGARTSSGWDDFEAERKKWGYTFTFDGMHLMPETAEEFAKHIVPFLKNQI